MQFIAILKSILALLLVLSMIAIIYLIFKKYIFKSLGYMHNTQFKIKEILYIDKERKLISIESKNKDYILLLGNSEQLIEIINHEKN